MKLISIIDPGHRKDTPGKRANGLEEWEFNESVSKLLGTELSKYGEVYYTIETEKHPYPELTGEGRSKNLSYRTTNANNVYWEAVKKYGKDNFKIVFISIHANAFNDQTVSGYEVFVYKHGSEAYELAKSIHRQAQLILDVGTDIKDRRIKEANFAVLKNTIMPAILIEHEFYTNPIGAKKLLDPVFREKCSEHIVKGVLDYTGIIPAKEVKIIYRVRKEWKDSKSQKGAYSVLQNAIDEAKKHDGYKVYDDKGKQVYPGLKDDTDHWAYKHYQNLNKKGFSITETRFNDNITRGEMFKLLDELTDNSSVENELGEFTMKEGDITMQYRLLKQGMKGTDVKALQESLIRLGYDTNGVDGIFGTGTNNAVKQFQRANGLRVDGMVGPATIVKLEETCQNKNTQAYEILKPNYYTTVVKIPKKNIEKARVIDGKTKTMANVYNGLTRKPNFMINGGLYWMKKGKSYSLNLLFIDGKQVNAGIYSRFGFMGYKDNSFKFDNYKYTKDLVDILGGSPSLIINGAINIDTKGFEKSKGIINYKHPRSAIGESNTHFFLVAVDGRKNGKGMTIKELANFMKGLGCINAINFDGGGSTRLMQGLKVLNNPLENRAVNNMIGVYLK